MSQVSFHYKAVDTRGTRTAGSILAVDRDEAYRRLVATGLRPLRLRGASRRRGRRKRVSTRDLAHLTFQLGVLMEARIPIGESLRSIAEQENNGQLADSGNMIAVLERLAGMLERRHDMNQSVRGALLYPICVVASIAIAVTFLLLFVVPRFTSLYTARGVDLPWMTQLLVGLSGACRGYWWLILSLLVIGVFGVRRGMRNATFRRRVDDLLHRVPILRDLLRGMSTGRFAHVLGISLRSGLSLIEGLEMAGASCGRPLLQADAQKMASQVNHGRRLTDVMLACAYLPSFARRMIAAGEDAGELPRMCEIVARHFDRETEYIAKSLTTLIEPFLIAGLAGIVLIVALGIFLPMWNMATLLG
jgi:MSHA biogenesis protein MshG